MELLSWRNGRTSIREVANHLGQVDDNEPEQGIEDSEDRILQMLDEVMQEAEARSDACGAGYPFTQNAAGVLTYDETKKRHPQSRIYCYLLLSTRLNMAEDRTQAEIDGTWLFEQLAVPTLCNYLGARSRSVIFGTSAAERSFPARVNGLCNALHEGGGFESRSGRIPSAGDDKLDVVAWTPFSDKLPGKIILFGQCKTGTNWRDHVGQLQPDAFCHKWIRNPFGTPPVRTFLVAEAEERLRFPETVQETGLFFDRCRIVDACVAVDEALADRIANWTNAAFSRARRMLG